MPILLSELQHVGDNLFRYFIYASFASFVEQLSQQYGVTLLYDHEKVLQVQLACDEYMWPLKPGHVASGTC